jgi:hypothetical protein
MDVATRVPSSSRAPLVIGVAAALVWLHYLPSLWPLPPRSDLPVDIQWSLWWESLLLTALGFAAAALAIRAVRYWQVAIAVTSGFIVVSSLPQLVSDLVQAPSFEAWFGLFHGARSGTLYYLLVLPLYHLALVAAVLVHAALTLGARAHGQRNAA